MTIFPDDWIVASDSSGPVEPKEGPTITVAEDGTWLADGVPLCRPTTMIFEARLAQPDQECDG